MDGRRSWPRGRGLVVAALAFIPLAVLATVAVLTAARAYRVADEARLRTTATAMAAVIDSHLAGMLAVARTLASVPSLDPGGDLDRFVAIARPVGEDFGGWFVVVGPPPDLELEAITLRDMARRRGSFTGPTTHPMAAEALDEVFSQGAGRVTDLFDGPMVGRRIAWVTAPVRRDGRTIRALAFAFEPARLQALLAQQDLPLGTFAALADGNGRVVAVTGQPVGDGMVDAGIMDALRGMGEGSSIFRGRTSEGQDDVFALARPRSAPRWAIIVASPQALQQAEGRRIIG